MTGRIVALAPDDIVAVRAMKAEVACTASRKETWIGFLGTRTR